MESVILSRTKVSLEVGKSITIEANVNPSNATNKNISWQSSNNSVANVSDGKIIGVGSGTATITAVAHNGKGKECQVTVSGASAVMPTSINLNSQSEDKNFNENYYTYDSNKYDISYNEEIETNYKKEDEKTLNENENAEIDNK